MFRHSQRVPLPIFSVGLFKLRARLGMSDYKFASKVKEKLKLAVTDLIERGCLSDMECKKSKGDDESAFFLLHQLFRSKSDLE